MNYKAKIEITNEGIKITSFHNRLIPFGLLRELNKAVLEVADRANGKLAWKRSYIRFTHEGKTYYQVDENGGLCHGCCFLRKDKEEFSECLHPHYKDGTKGDCKGLIYKEETK